MSPFVYGLVAFLHLVGVVMAIMTVYLRGFYLRDLLFTLDDKTETAAEKRALMADNFWGVSSLIVVPTGLYRLFSLGKGLEFYLKNPFFYAKFTLFAIVFALELWPMFVLVKHRIARKRTGSSVLTVESARAIAAISYVQAVFTIGILFCATMFARGVAQMS